MSMTTQTHKTTYVATTPDGNNTATRKSVRAVTHASWIEREPGHQVIMGFHNSYAQAAKTVGGQSAAQTAYFKTFTHGVVEATVQA